MKHYEIYTHSGMLVGCVLSIGLAMDMIARLKLTTGGRYYIQRRKHDKQH
jgi:hypothetical protein